MFKKNSEDDKDPIRKALEEILAKAKEYQFSPLEEKMKSKMKPAMEEPEEEESEDAIESSHDEEDELELTEEQKKKLLELLG